MYDVGRVTHMNPVLAWLLSLSLLTACGQPGTPISPEPVPPSPSSSAPGGAGDPVTPGSSSATRRLRLTVDDRTCAVTLYDTPAAERLYEMLPLELTFEDFNGTEKIGYLPQPLDTGEGANGVDPAVGDLCLYAPWGNLCIFYQDSGYSDGLLPLRRIEAGMDLITEMDGPFTATLEAAPSILVAYFSCTGNTETVAGRLSDRLAADLYEIVPEDPYTSADLDYSDPSSHASQEQNDAAARPAISDEVTSMEGYDVVFLGYPIWWGQAPRIISTFLEHYDFEGKTIVPFCTSGSSGIGASATDLHGLAPSTSWLSGRRFSGTVAASELAEWVSELSLPEGTVSAKAA